ncbi:MAG: hypothetical protein U1B30_05415, partial [Pseudomonadota bacterium]|nr:hypothetical protein [Pseudomonadota bacterium]
METEEHFMDHPDVKIFMNQLFPILVKESDRGAVLLASSQIDEQLNNFFDQLVPSKTSNKRKKEILSYPGPFSTLASKLNIAYV